MNKVLVKILFIAFIVPSAYSQITLEEYPTRKIIKSAKMNTKKQLDSLGKILQIRSSDLKLKGFELDFCTRDNSSNKGGSFYTPVGNFPVVTGCPGKYNYTYVQNRNGGGYLITFFYDLNGRIVDQEIGFEMSSH